MVSRMMSAPGQARRCRMAVARPKHAIPTSPMSPARAQYRQLLQGSPVGATGTLVGVVVEVTLSRVVVVAPPELSVVVVVDEDDVEPGEVVEVVDVVPPDVVDVVVLAQVGRVMTLSSSVTSPLRASTRPSTVAPVS